MVYCFHFQKYLCGCTSHWAFNRDLCVNLYKISTFVIEYEIRVIFDVQLTIIEIYIYIYTSVNEF